MLSMPQLPTLVSMIDAHHLMGRLLNVMHEKGEYRFE